VISDLEAIKAIDRLCAVSRNLDHIGLREWIAAHCGLNPHAAGTLDPDAKLIAERDKLAASLAAMRDKADRLAALLAASETRRGELAAELAAVKKSGNRPSNSGLSPSNADTTP
jgi:hypothetical protein